MPSLCIHLEELFYYYSFNYSWYCRTLSSYSVSCMLSSINQHYCYENHLVLFMFINKDSYENICRFSSKVIVDKFSIKQGIAKRILSFLTLAVEVKLEKVSFPGSCHGGKALETM